jgi:hypothetical protein
MRRAMDIQRSLLGIAFGAACLLPAPLAAQNKDKVDPAFLPTPQMDGHPDLSGRWGGNGGFFAFKDAQGTTHIYLPGREAPKSADPNDKLARYYLQVDGDRRRAENPDKPPYKPDLLVKVHQLDRDENKLDPVVKCHPPGVPRMGPPARIVQSKGWIVFIYVTEPGNFERLIPTDGRPHRTDLDPSYNGDSVARWEGDTLVVDDTGFNEDTWLGSDGWYHSDKMHVIERFTRKGNTLLYEVTVEDPEVFTKPWVKRPRVLKLDANPLDEVYDAPYCESLDADHIVNHDHF